MSRQIKSTGSAGNNYAEALRKLIPAEILIFYFSLISAMPEQLSAMITVTVISVLITPVYLMKVSLVKSIKQISLSTLSLLIYSVLFGALSTYVPEAMNWIPTLIAMTWTFAVPFLFMSTKTIESPEV